MRKSPGGRLFTDKLKLRMPLFGPLVRKTQVSRFSRTLGLDPKEMRYIGVKSAAHFRAAFESWAGSIHLIAERALAPVERMLALG